jgi:DNA-directed RNA polymerase subunit L
MGLNELDVLPGNYILELDVKNETLETIIVTTEDFVIRHKQTGQLLSKEQTHKIFPPNEKTNYYIDFVRLLPKVSETIPAAQIKLSADFFITTAKENPVFSVVSTCTYINTVDAAAAETAWREIEERYRGENMKAEEITFHKKNFYLLDAKRHFVAGSFDFTVESVGPYENIEIVHEACSIIQRKLQERIDQLDSGLEILIHKSENTMPNSWDVIFKDEDYTIGKVLEYILHETFIGKKPLAELTMTYCGFKKFHPHDLDSTIRVAYQMPMTADIVRGQFRSASVEAIALFERIGIMFGQSTERSR